MPLRLHRTIRAALAVAAAGAACGRPAEPDPAQELPMPFHVIAHRGASAYAPENTLAAFEMAARLGAPEVELDVQLTRDGVLVLFHDDELDGKTNGTGAVRDHTVEELAGLDIGSWFDASHPGLPTRYAGTGLATLAQIFERFGPRFHYHVEIKAEDEEIPSRLLSEVQRFGLSSHVTVTSFSLEPLRRIRELDESLPICLLVKDTRKLRALAADDPELASLGARDLQRHWIDLAARERFQQVGLPAEDLTRGIVRHARGLGLEIRAWRIRGDDDMERALRMGANGMTTNWPDRLQERIERWP